MEQLTRVPGDNRNLPATINAFLAMFQTETDVFDFVSKCMNHVMNQETLHLHLLSYSYDRKSAK